MAGPENSSNKVILRFQSKVFSESVLKFSPGFEFFSEIYPDFFLRITQRVFKIATNVPLCISITTSLKIFNEILLEFVQWFIQGFPIFLQRISWYNADVSLKTSAEVFLETSREFLGISAGVQEKFLLYFLPKFRLWILQLFLRDSIWRSLQVFSWMLLDFCSYNCGRTKFVLAFLKRNPIKNKLWNCEKNLSKHF